MCVSTDNLPSTSLLHHVLSLVPPLVHMIWRRPFGLDLLLQTCFIHPLQSFDGLMLFHAFQAQMEYNITAHSATTARCQV